MSPWRGSLLSIGMSILLFASEAIPCSCAWEGPFFAVLKNSPLVIIGRILRHHLGSSPTMDVLILETLKGGVFDSGMVVQMGDGMHCRPPLEGFPPGSEWILALNGPGSKPGSGWALSHCGEYWLRVKEGEVIGSIDGTFGQEKKMSLEEFRRRFPYPRFKEIFEGRVKHGKGFLRPFGSRFQFILQPMPDGWEIVIKERGRDENLARLTPPLHGASNPRYIEGWHLSEKPSGCATREYLADAGPENPRRFIFSPEVGGRIDGPNAGRAVTTEEIEAIRSFGRGTLTLERFELGAGKDGCPKIEWMAFSVHLEGGY